MAANAVPIPRKRGAGLGVAIDDDEIDGDTFATVGSLTDFVSAKC
jgi:hypothetical protein